MTKVLPEILLSLVSKGGLPPRKPRSIRGGSGGDLGATRRAEREGLTLVEQGAEREVRKGAENGSKGEGTSGVPNGSTLWAKGSQSGVGKGSQFEKGLVGEGWCSPGRRHGGVPASTEFRPASRPTPPAEMKLQGSIRCRTGEGRGRGMTFTSSRRVFGLQSRGSGKRAMGR